MGWLSAIPIIGKTLDTVFGTIDKMVTDKDKANELKNEISLKMMHGDSVKFVEQIKSQMNIIVAEAQSQSWLARNWRPGLMSLFGLIIFNNYVFNPWLNAFFSINIMMEIPPDMWGLLKLGVGGYVVGRSGEKVVELWKK